MNIVSRQAARKEFWLGLAGIGAGVGVMALGRMDWQRHYKAGDERFPIESVILMAGGALLSNISTVRYAETVLNWIEAKAELADKFGGAAVTQADLDKSINAIRQRPLDATAIAKGVQKTAAMDINNLPNDPERTAAPQRTTLGYKTVGFVSPLLWEIRRERRMEFFLEKVRSLDIRRWGQLELMLIANNPDLGIGGYVELDLAATLKAEAAAALGRPAQETNLKKTSDNMGYNLLVAANKDIVSVMPLEGTNADGTLKLGARKFFTCTESNGVITSSNYNEMRGFLVSRPIPDLGRGLQGTTPGMTVQVGSSEVGSDARIRIRGQVGSEQGSASPLILLDNVEIPSLNLVNPDDIESISVLKDAASASIYGAKAAFGVVLITSKKGAKEAEKVSVTYSGNMAFQSLAKNYQMADVEALHYWVVAGERVGTTTPVGTFMKVDRAGYNAAVAWKEKYGNTVAYDDPMVYGRDWYIGSDGKSKIGVRTYDPYKYLVRSNAPSQTHNVAVAGSKGNTNFNVSLGYLNQKGMLKVTDYDYFSRYNANVRLDTKVNNWLGVHGGIMFTHSTKSWAFATSSTTADPWYYAFRWASNYPLVATDENGNALRNPTCEIATGKDYKISQNPGWE